MGHVLLLAYFYPPALGGGVARPKNMAERLGQLGWRVTVVTIQAEGADRWGQDPGEPHQDRQTGGAAPAVVERVRELPLSWLLGLLGRALRGVRRVSEWAGHRQAATRWAPLEDGFVAEETEIEASKAGWAAPALARSWRVHRRDPLGIAVASLPPASSGLAAWALRLATGVPYVVEYRDPWTVTAFWACDPSGAPRGDVATKLRLRIARLLEAELLRRAAAAVIVNGSRHVERLRQEFPTETNGKPIVQIANGVDLRMAGPVGVQGTVPGTMAPGIDPGSARQILRILHAGFFYHFHSPYYFLDALRQASAPREALAGLQVEFLGGGFPPRLARAVEEWGLGSMVKITPAIPHREALAALACADALLIVLPPLDAYVDCIPTKLYEYLATDRPIIGVVHPSGAAAALLRQDPASIVLDNTESPAVADGLADLVVRARREGLPQPDPGRARQHSYAQRAQELSDLLESVRRATPVPKGRARLNRFPGRRADPPRSACERRTGPTPYW